LDSLFKKNFTFDFKVFLPAITTDVLVDLFDTINIYQKLII
jgi:hypothetical protein